MIIVQLNEGLHKFSKQIQKSSQSCVTNIDNYLDPKKKYMLYPLVFYRHK